MSLPFALLTLTACSLYVSIGGNGEHFHGSNGISCYYSTPSSPETLKEMAAMLESLSSN
jgi:hypothetical protein